MLSQGDWLKNQRVSGGYNWSSAMLLNNCNAKQYVQFFMKRIQRLYNIELVLNDSYRGLEISSGHQIVWSGQSVDVDILRMVRFDFFEEIMIGNLKEIGLLN